MTVSDISVVSVCYNSADIVREMLKSVPANTNIILVDNGSQDVAELEPIAETNGATLVKNTNNVGFGVACNQGAELADTEFVFFLNPDTVLTSETLAGLVRAARKHPDCVAFNPLIIDPQGKASLKRRSVLIPKRDWLPRGLLEKDTIVPILSGAAFFVRKSDFDSVGGFDPEIFMYHEDDDLSLRLRSDRGNLMVAAGARVTHTPGTSTVRAVEVSKIKAFGMGKSRIYTARKHNVPFGELRAVLQAVLQLFSISMFSSRKRAKNIAFFRGVMSEIFV